MKLLYITSWYHANINRWLSEAFEDAGFEVIRVGSTHFNHYGIAWEPELAPKMTEIMPEDTSLDLPALIDKYSPDMVLLWDWTGEPPCYEVLNIDKTRKIKDKMPFIYVQHEGWKNALERISLFNPTVAYTGMPYGVYESPCSAKGLGYKYLPGACYPKIHKPNLDWHKKDLECVLLAGMYKPRPQLCEALKRFGVNIHWGNANVMDYVKYHQRSFSTWEFSGGTPYIKWRFFEAMAMGCVMISDRISLMDNLGFGAGKHYIEYILNDDREPWLEDLKIRIKALASNQGLYEEISKQAYDFVIENHTYAHRIAQIRSDINV